MFQMETVFLYLALFIVYFHSLPQRQLNGSLFAEGHLWLLHTGSPVAFTLFWPFWDLVGLLISYIKLVLSYGGAFYMECLMVRQQPTSSASVDLPFGGVLLLVEFYIWWSF
mmetsp:Transcript_2077/g.3121  ORF Transcript_2077/g.3121 Transcript_2077/m.3121 type:complete len:111 (-) Transcript_2077:260-592(-)